MTVLRILVLLVLLACCPTVFSDSPSQLGPTTFLGVGGDYVISDGEWAMVGDRGVCELNVYQQFSDIVVNDWFDFDESQTIIVPPSLAFLAPFFCGLSDFADSAALSGDVLVVGTPVLPTGIFSSTNTGGFIVYQNVGGTWTNQIAGNSWLDIVEIPAGAADNDLVGASVAVTRLTSTEYVIVVGAPGADAVGADSGRIYLYLYNTSANTLTPVTSRDGGAAGESYGTSVVVDLFTSSPVTIMVAAGAPTVAGAGRVEVTQFTGAALVNPVDLTVTGSDRLGTQVSLSSSYLLASADSVSSVWANTGTLDAPAWNPRTGSLPYLGGVSQTNPGIFGDNGSGAAILRDPYLDVVPDDGINVVLASAEDQVDMDNESVWFGQSASNSAVLFQFPCGYGQKLVVNEWALVTIPCKLTAPNDTVATVFGGNLEPGSNYWVYAVDDLKVANARPYTGALASGATIEQGRSYWVYTDQGQYFSIGAGTSTEFTEVGATPVPGAPENTHGFFEFTIPEPLEPGTSAPDPGAGSDDFARVMGGNPWTSAIDTRDIYYNGVDGIETFTDASAPGTPKLNPNIYVWDPVNGMVGQGYRAVTAGTPGFDSLIRPGEGFWIKALEASATGGTGGTLLLPLSE